MFNFEKQPEKQEFSLVAAGDYETFIERAEERPTKSGRKKLRLMLRIRDDIRQDFQNRCVFCDICKKKPENLTDADRQVEGYIYRHLYHLLDVTGILSSGKDFESMADICRLLIGKELRVTVFHEKGTDGVIREKIDPLNGVHESDPSAEDYIAYEHTDYRNDAPAYSAPPAPAIPPVSGSLDDFRPLNDDEFPF